MKDNPKHLAEAVRAACAEAALAAYEDAGFSGLCAEGRWECAVEAIRHLDVTDLVQQYGTAPSENDR